MPATIAKGASPAVAQKGRRAAVFRQDGTPNETPVYDGALLGADARVTGPAIIEESTTTIVIEPGWQAVLDRSGSYVITPVQRQ
jgi:N-methylhydantoinase A